MLRSILVVLFLAAPGTAQKPAAGQPATPVGNAPGSGVPQKGDAKGPAAQDPGSAWVAVRAKRLEVAAGEGHAVEVFEFANPNDAPVEFRSIEASCACSRATIVVGEQRYELVPKPWSMFRVETTPDGETRTAVTSIPVGPRERGTFEVHLALEGAKTKSVGLNVHTTDPATPMIHLTVDAVGQRMLSIEPQEVDLGVVEPRSVRDFTVTVRSPFRKEFEVRSASEPPKELAVRLESATVDGSQVWTIHGTLTAGVQRSAAGAASDSAVLKFGTSIESESGFQVRVVWKVAQSVEATPGFLSMGQLKKGSKSTHAIRLARGDGKPLAAKAVRFEGLPAGQEYVTATMALDGAVAVVEVVVGELAPKGLLRGEVVIELDHPTAAEQRIGFNGFVR